MTDGCGKILVWCHLLSGEGEHTNRVSDRGCRLRQRGSGRHPAGHSDSLQPAALMSLHARWCVEWWHRTSRQGGSACEAAPAGATWLIECSVGQDEGPQLGREGGDQQQLRRQLPPGLRAKLAGQHQGEGGAKQ